LSLASIASAGLVQADGWQCWFQTVQQRLMAVMTSLTLAKPPPGVALALDDRDQHLDQIQPRRRHRGVIQLDPRVLGEPIHRPWRSLVRGLCWPLEHCDHLVEGADDALEHRVG
jgi:hypothetical protein